MSTTTPDISLRAAIPADLEVLCKLWTNLMAEHEALDDRFECSEDAAQRWKNDFPIWLEDSTRQFIVTVLDKEIIGFVQAHRQTEPPIYKEVPEIYIDEIFVDDRFRSLGIGRALLEAVKKWAVEVGAERLRFCVLAANEAGALFWEREGAKPLAITYTIPLTITPSTEKKKRVGKLGF